MENDLRTISACRVCGNQILERILSLGDLYVSNFVDGPDPSEKKYPLELVLCNEQGGGPDASAGAGCGLLQLRHTVSNEIMYRNYWYRSGTNQTMTNELTGIAEKVKELVPLSPDDCVIDIGCNDGTLLRAYGDGVTRVGFEPARNLVPVAALNATKVINDFWNAAAFEREFPGKKAKAITSIAMFYDLDEPNAFVGDIARALDREGVWIIQMSYLPLMLSENAFDNICVKPDTVIVGDNQPIANVTTDGFAVGGGGTLVGVRKTMQRAYSGNLVQIRPMYLDTIVLTPNHPLRIVRREQLRFNCGQLRRRSEMHRFEWVRADDVRRGDWVVVPRLAHGVSPKSIDLRTFNRLDDPHHRRGLLSLPLTEDTAWMLGMYVAEGHVGGRRGNPYLNFTLHEKEDGIRDRIALIFASLGYRANTVSYGDRKSIEVRVVCAALARACHAWFRGRAVEKRIPDFLLTASKEIKTAFLRGLFEGDGYVKGNQVHFHTSSKVLAFQVQLMVASLGGMLGMTYVKPYPRVIRGGRVHSGDSWQLRGRSKILASIFEYVHHGTSAPHAVVAEGYILVPVAEIGTENYKGPVHNIATGDATYLVSNATVHNCHEHLEYYSLLSLENLLQRHGLEVFDAELNDVNGGSFRIYMRHTGQGRTIRVPEGAAERLKKLRDDERALGLSDRAPYEAFNARVEDLKARTVAFLNGEAAKGKKIYIYGASTKGNTLLQYYGLDASVIPFAVERNQDKWGKKTVGSLIPIVSEEQARLDKPDYFLALPWHFMKEFLSREAEFLAGGGKFIVPLPDFKVIP